MRVPLQTPPNPSKIEKSKRLTINFLSTLQFPKHYTNIGNATEDVTKVKAGAIDGPKIFPAAAH